MIIHLKPETVYWLLPVVFIIHDFEEIIMVRPWMRANSGRLRARFPRAADTLINSTGSLSTNAYALIVAIEFVILSLSAFLASEYGLVFPWAGFTLAFCLHGVMHCAQFIAWRGYVPAILTIIPSALYAFLAIDYLVTERYLISASTALYTAAAIVFIGPLFVAGISVARKFDRWLAAYQK